MSITKDLPTQIEKVRKVVQDYFDKNGVHNLPLYIDTWESKDHIINIGTSILMAKWGIGYPPGGFVQAVVDNDLMGAFTNADHVNQHAMRFYVMLMYNVGRPSDL